MPSRYARWFELRPHEAWLLRQPGWVIAALSIALSLLFWLSAALLIWPLSQPPRISPPLTG